ncbi:hypothetical protein [Lentzea cavernae]|uniref:Uncharacterized protein n=1 Tax=Lentzea cavernae TaxID=2020703 RepID=A0ABQ3LZE9_9PSEU|nr:hypothetical protein [Lentzea cavernae]GHH27636.1 hypothetical protein GCM10017774_00480 [Lentzea cavernae]
MLLPTARGPLSAGIIAVLLGVDQGRPPSPPAAAEPDRLVTDADFQLALWISLEMLDGGFDGVAPDRPEQPGVLNWQTVLSEHWMAALRAMTASAVREAGGDTASPARVGDHLISLMRAGHTALYSFIENRATAAQIRELVTAKSLFARQADRHTVVERVPAVAIAAHNTMRVLGLGHAESATAAGHQAASAAISLLSDRRLARGLQRLGLPSRPPEQVQETAEQRWSRLLTVCREHLSANPARTQDLLHAAAAAVELEARLCAHLLRCWTQAAPVLEPQRPVAVTVIGGDRVLTPPSARLGTP